MDQKEMSRKIAGSATGKPFLTPEPKARNDFFASPKARGGYNEVRSSKKKGGWSYGIKGKTDRDFD
jgi:hypothetical protein